MNVQLYLPLAPFIEVRDGDPLAAQIANRHYSRLWRGNTNQSRLCVGKRMILVEPTGKWVFAWSQMRYRMDGQAGINCVLFRNESTILSSEIILMAEKAWIEKYGLSRFFTYVNSSLIKSTNPGFCFQQAGWTKQSVSKVNKLVLLAKEVQ